MSRDQNRLIADLLASISKLLKLEAAAKSGNLVGTEARIPAIEGEYRAAQAALASIDDREACHA